MGIGTQLPWKMEVQRDSPTFGAHSREHPTWRVTQCLLPFQGPYHTWYVSLRGKIHASWWNHHPPRAVKRLDVKLLVATFPLSNPIKISLYSHTWKLKRVSTGVVLIIGLTHKQWSLRALQMTTDWFLIGQGDWLIFRYLQKLSYSRIIPTDMYIWLDTAHLQNKSKQVLPWPTFPHNPGAWLFLLRVPVGM